MTTTLQPRPAARTEVAIVGIDRLHAETLVLEADGNVTVDSVDLADDEASQSRAMLHVVETIGDAPRVMLLGDPVLRIALEREYVALGGRPDRLVDLH